MREKLVQVNCVGGLEVDEASAMSVAMRIVSFEPDALIVCPSNPAMYVSALVEGKRPIKTDIWPDVADIGHKGDTVLRVIRAIDLLRQTSGSRLAMVVHPGLSAYLLAAIENVSVNEIIPIWWGSSRVVKV